MRPRLCPSDELQRLEALRRYRILDTPPEPMFDELAALVARVCEAPIALISLIDQHRQWFKSKIGFTYGETRRDVSFCAHAILGPGLLVVPDATKDERFADNPFVQGEPRIRFYAGAPLTTSDGHRIGALSILGQEPREFSPSQQDILSILSRQVMTQLELRRQALDLGESVSERKACESKLREREEQLRLFTEFNPAAVAMFDGDMRYIVVSRQWLEDYRIREESILGRSHYELFPDLPQRWIDIHRRCLLGATEACDEDLFHRADGSTHWVRWKVQPWRQAEGSVGGLIIFSEAITARKQAEANLRASEASLAAAQAQAHLGSWELDLTTLEGHWSAEMSRLHYRDPSLDAPGYSEFMEMVHPDDRAILRDGHLRTAQTTEPVAIAFRTNPSIGPLRHISATMQSVRDAAGRPVRLTGTSLDVTERRKAEQHIQQLNRVYAVLSDINQVIVRQRDARPLLDDACQIAVDRGQFRMAWIGLLDPSLRMVTVAAQAGTVQGYLDNMAIPLDEGPRSLGPTGRAMRSGTHVICNDIEQDQTMLPWREDAMTRGYRASAAFPLLVNDTPIGTLNLYSGIAGFFDAEEVRLLDELAMDISFAMEVSQREAERRAAEDELRRKTAFFEAQVESSLDGILVVSHGRERILQNRRLNELLELPPHIVENRQLAAQVQFVASRTKNPEQFIEKITYLYAHPDETSRDVIELVDGKVLDRASYPVQDSAGKRYGRIWIYRDITEQRQLEAKFLQAQKMEAIGQLAGGVAHDFNNLLTVIHGYGTLLMSGAETPLESAEAVQQIVHAAERAANLTRQLLAFSRRQVMRTRLVDLNELVASLVTMLQRIVGEDVRLELDLHPQPLHTRADAGMLDQVLLNLVVNARDAMPDGGLLVVSTGERVFTKEEAAAFPETLPGRYVSMRVSDTGAGIAPEYLSHLFEPFFTTKGPGKGTGLGLATVFGIVKQHGGVVTVETQIGHGATFRVFLPASESQGPSAEDAAAKAKVPGGHETILLVEDDPAVRVLTRTILERAGYRVLEAANGVEAVALSARHRENIQLLFTDIVMPAGINGLELATRLQAGNPRLRVVFSSGYSADIAGRELALQEGQNFIQKPSSPQHLLKTVRRCLEG